jgi:CHASE2 domain-containing sensor protein
MTRHDVDELGPLGSLRLLITIGVAGVASASSVGLVAIIDTWWILAFAVLFFLCATGVVLTVIVREMDRDERSQPR